MKRIKHAAAMEQRHGRHAQLLYPGAWAFVGGARPGDLEGVDGCGRHLRAAAVNGGAVAAVWAVGNGSGGGG